MSLTISNNQSAALALRRQMLAQQRGAAVKTPSESIENILGYDTSQQGVEQGSPSFPRVTGPGATEITDQIPTETYPGVYEQDEVSIPAGPQDQLNTFYKGQLPASTYGLQDTGETDVAGRPVQNLVQQPVNTSVDEEINRALGILPTSFSNLTSAEQSMIDMYNQGSLQRVAENLPFKYEVSKNDLPQAAAQLHLASQEIKARTFGSVEQDPDIHMQVGGMDTVVRALGVDVANENDLNKASDAMLFARQKVLNDASLMMSRQYEKGDTRGIEFEGDEQDARFGLDVKNRVSESDLSTEVQNAMRNLTNQPILLSQLASMANSAKNYYYQRPTSELPEAVAGESTDRTDLGFGANMAYQALLSGYADLAKNKRGQYFIVPGRRALAQHRLITLATDAMDLTKRLENLVVANTHQSVGGIPANAAAQFIKTKAYKNEDVIEVGMGLVDSIGLQSDPDKLSVLRGMYSDIFAKMIYFKIDRAQPSGYSILTPEEAQQVMESGIRPGLVGKSFGVYPAYSTSIYAKTLLDLSPARFIELVRSHGKDGKVFTEDANGKALVNPVISEVAAHKSLQIEKHIGEYLDRIKQGVWFGALKRSEMTHRVFQRATDINWINHSGTIRAALAFANKPTMRIENVINHISRGKAVAKQLANVKGTGDTRGLEQLKLLSSLSEQEQMILGSTYILANAIKEIDGETALNLPLHYTIWDVINSFTPEMFNRLANYGEEARAWATSGKMPETLEGNWFNEVNKKKEWFPVFDAALMAADMRMAEKLGGKHVALKAIVEKDSSQSNAFIQALSIGDVGILRMQGVPLNDIVSEFKNLREKAASTIDQDIDAALGEGDDSAEMKTALSNFFSKVRNKAKGRFSKLYARGIVVAGLYGKFPLFMFEEAETMLYEIAELDNDMQDEVTKLFNLFDNDNEKLYSTIASVYYQSFNTHMKSLSIYQKVMKGMASIIAAADGSSVLKTYGNQLVNMASAHGILSKHDLDKLLKLEQQVRDTGAPAYSSSTALPSTVLATSEQEGVEIPAYRSVKSLRASGKEKASFSAIERKQKDLVETEEGKEYGGFFAGNAFRDAFPVLTTQSGDAFMWFSSAVVANKYMNKKHALNTLPIHDAVLGDSLSIIPFLIAYNNVAPYLVAKEAQRMWEGFKDHVVEARDEAISFVKKKGFADIGEEGKFAALSGFLDRTFHYAHSKQLDKANKEDKDSAFSKEKNKLIIKVAMENGYLPPTDKYQNKRSRMLITPKQFEELMELIQEANGFSAKAHSKNNIPGHNSNWKELSKFTNQINQLLALLKTVSRDIVNMR